MTIIGKVYQFHRKCKTDMKEKQTEISFIFEKIKEMENIPLSDIWRIS